MAKNVVWLSEYRRRGAAPPTPEQMASTVVRAAFTTQVQKDGDGQGYIFILATGDTNRNGWKLNPSGWKLDNFKANPVFLWAHDDSKLPIGRCDKVWVEGDLLKIHVIPTPRGLSSFNDTIWDLYDKDFLKSVSAGWLPLKYALIYDEKDHWTGNIECEEQELVEGSAVPIPAEPRALRVAAAGGIDVGPMRAWCKAMLDEPRYLITVPDSTRPEASAAVRQQFLDFYPAAKVLVVPKSVGIAAMDGTDPIREASQEMLGEVLAAGRVLSAANEEALSSAQANCQDAMDHMAAVLNDSKDPENPNASALSTNHADRLGTASGKCQEAVDQMQGVLDQVVEGDATGDGEGGSEAGLHSLQTAGVVPKNVSTEIAPEDQAWAKPTLADFTDKAWGDLSDAEKTAIAGHFAWAAAVPPATFGDLKFPHHDPKTHKAVWHGVANCLARLSNSSVPGADKAKVQAHLDAHKKAFGKDQASADAYHGSADWRKRQLALLEF